MFNIEQNSTTMNEKQEAKTKPAMWENSRFKNWVAVARACHLVQQELARQLRPLDLKTPHLDIMVNLVRSAGISQQDLARKLFVGRSNMTMLLPQLEKRGLVERRADPADKRVLRLYLTAEGRALADRAIVIQAAIIDDMMSATTPEECEMVGDAMRRIVARLLEMQSAAEETESE
ncbi:MarR family transcriptional regulator [Oricola sp. NBU1457]|uniref:MarR family winged helix-turn-helix transcriptional regulator n=1 Tax=Oricola nitratireducens TaxID=2775868 RepID=UPI0018660199